MFYRYLCCVIALFTTTAIAETAIPFAETQSDFVQHLMPIRTKGAGGASCQLSVKGFCERSNRSPSINAKVQFRYNSAEIDLDKRQVLDALAAALRQELRTMALVVVGHTDSIGSDAYNDALSKRRAESVVEYLVAQGVERGRLRSEGDGEQRPLATNATAAGRAVNRRVEFVNVGYYARSS